MSQHDASGNEPVKGDPTLGQATAHDETSPIETLLDESDAAKPPTAETPAARTQPVQTQPSPAGAYAAPWPAQEFKSGPAPVTSVIGLLGLLTAIAVLITQATDLDIHWGVVGPVAVVGAGVLLVVLGLAGLRGQRFRG